MRIALINPPWSFAGSICFGCREPHLPLELALCRALLSAGHQARMFDCHLMAMSIERASQRGRRVPAGHDGCHDRADVPALRLLNYACRGWCCTVAKGGRHQGPRGGAPRFDNAARRPAHRKLDADVIVIGECEETLAAEDAGSCPALPTETSTTRSM